MDALSLAALNACDVSFIFLGRIFILFMGRIKHDLKLLYFFEI
jgi:hypothetical protein